MQSSLQQINQLHIDIKEDILPFIDTEDFPAIIQELQNSLDNLARPLALIVFNGIFSSGKSSVLNLLLGRDILPYDEFRETGAPCMLSAGNENRIVAHRKDGRRDIIPFSKETIREQISLTYGLEWGRARAEVDTQFLTISLEGSPIPKNMIWIDAPGIDDPQTAAIAYEQLRTADLLAIIIHTASRDTKQLNEMVKEVWLQKSPAELVFIINVWYSDDKGNTPEAWMELFNTSYPSKVAEIKEAFQRNAYPYTDQLRFFPIVAKPDANFPELETHRINLLNFFGEYKVTGTLLAQARLGKIETTLRNLAGQMLDWIEVSPYKEHQNDWDDLMKIRRGRMEREADGVWELITQLIDKIDKIADHANSYINTDTVFYFTEELLTDAIYADILTEIDTYTTYLTQFYKVLLITIFVNKSGDKLDWDQTFSDVRSEVYMNEHHEEMNALKDFLFSSFFEFPRRPIQASKIQKNTTETNLNFGNIGSNILAAGASFFTGNPLIAVATWKSTGAFVEDKIVQQNDLEASVIETKNNINKAVNTVKKYIKDKKEDLLIKWHLDIFDRIGKVQNPDSYLVKLTYYEYVQLLGKLLIEKADEAQKLANDLAD